MNENMSAHFRLGLMYALLSTVLTFVVSMFTLALLQMNNVSSDMGRVVITVEQSSISNMSGKEVTGASAYRLCTTYEGALQEFKIVDKNGDEYTTVEQLLLPDFINQRYYVNSSQMSNTGLWRMILEMR